MASNLLDFVCKMAMETLKVVSIMKAKPKSKGKGGKKKC